MVIAERLISAGAVFGEEELVRQSRGERARAKFGKAIKVAVPTGGFLISTATNWSITGMLTAAALKEGILNDLGPERAMMALGVLNFSTLFARARQEVSLLDEVDTSPGVTSTVVYETAKKIRPQSSRLRSVGAIGATLGVAGVSSITPLMFGLHSDAGANFAAAYFTAGTIINSTWWSINRGALEIARHGKNKT